MSISAWLIVLPLLCVHVCSDAAEKQASEMDLDAAIAYIDQSMVSGPRRIDLGDGAVLTLTKNNCFVGNDATVRYFRAHGRLADQQLNAGMVFPCGPFANAEWFVLVTIGHDGHVSENVHGWTADHILEILQAKATAANAVNKRRGLPGIEISGWTIPPVYNSAAHRLAWAAKIKMSCSVNCSSSEMVSYEAVILGRSGYVDVFTQASQRDFPRQKKIADDIRARISYLPTAEYSDFEPQLDRYAPYDLVGLLTGSRQ
ncbi:DUF2167 domain-containing protein (plasmid) [Paraburkholderia sp. PREW-6R]|uniref:DUF2167 domain-containing protein n=1 Tax=Paraburkholderia sp. PREW-6R TaxID=3141544 RepID=UPI0031F5A29C